MDDFLAKMIKLKPNFMQANVDENINLKFINDLF